MMKLFFYHKNYAQCLKKSKLLKKEFSKTRREWNKPKHFFITYTLKFLGISSDEIFLKWFSVS